MLDDKPLYPDDATPENNTKQVPGGLCLIGEAAHSAVISISGHEQRT